MTVDDLHISHNASGVEANIPVLFIRNSSSHSSLVVNGLELPCLVTTLHLYETIVSYKCSVVTKHGSSMVTIVVRSCAVDAKVT